MPRGAAGGIVTCWGGFFNRWKISLNIGGGGEIGKKGRMEGRKEGEDGRGENGEMQLSEREVRGLSEWDLYRPRYSLG